MKSAALISLTVLTLASCSRPGPAYQKVTALGVSADAPTGTVLTVTDASGHSTSFTRGDLAALGLVTYTTPDPSLKNRPVRYVGPLLSDLLRRTGIPQDATLHLVAHDRYTTNLDLKPLKDVPLVLALEADGKALKLSDQGPVYLVFPYQAYKLNTAKYDSAWVWQLERIEAR